MSSPHKSKIISAVYSATLSPDKFNETLDALDHLIFEHPSFSDGPIALNSEDQQIHASDPELLTHIKLAHDIQQRLGRDKEGSHKIQMLLDASSNPACFLDQDEAVIAMNSLAQEFLGKNCKSLQDFCANPNALKKIRRYLRSDDGEKTLSLLDHLNNEQRENTCVILEKLEQSHVTEDIRAKHPSESYYFLTIVNLGFDETTKDLLRNTYNLTRAEVDIAIHLASGMQIAEIAQLRRATVPTIRTQIKTIKKKTDARDIPAIVRLLSGISAGIIVPSYSGVSNEPTTQKQAKIQQHRLKLRDGRTMAYLEQGNPAGYPVLLVHNMPYGAELPSSANEAAYRLNLRIIAPFRPGYGNSDMLKKVQGDKLLTQVAADFYELLDRLGISSAVVLGQSVGSYHALRFARLYPNKVSRLIAVSRAPIWRDTWLAHTPKWQRFTLRIAMHFPQLIPLVIWAMVRYIDKGNSEAFIKDAIHGEADRKAIANPEILELMAESVDISMKQGVDAFCQDCFLALEDYTEEANSAAHRFHILHGSEDQVIPVLQSQAFVDSVPGTTLQIVPGAGQLLIYSHWEAILKAIKSMQITK